jgi:hypothetical protein
MVKEWRPGGCSLGSAGRVGREASAAPSSIATNSQPADCTPRALACSHALLSMPMCACAEDTA